MRRGGEDWLSTHHVEERMREGDIHVDHSIINREVIQYSSPLEEVFHRRKRPLGRSWLMNETYIRVKGAWRYLYRTVDKTGQTIDFRLTEHRVTEATLSEESHSPSSYTQDNYDRWERSECGRHPEL